MDPDAGFAGIPANYDIYPGPILFVPYALHLYGRIKKDKPLICTDMEQQFRKTKMKL